VDLGALPPSQHIKRNYRKSIEKQQQQEKQQNCARALKGCRKKPTSTSKAAWVTQKKKSPNTFSSCVDRREEKPPQHVPLLACFVQIGSFPNYTENIFLIPSFVIHATLLRMFIKNYLLL